MPSPSARPAVGTIPTNARAAALRMLAQRRLTEAQLWKKLTAKGYDDTATAAAVASCRVTNWAAV